MSSSNLSSAASTFFDETVTAYLAGQTTVTARPISFAEIEALASADGPNEITGFLLADPIPGFTTEDTLAPARVSIRRRSGSNGDVYGTKPGPQGTGPVPDRSTVVGHRVDVEVATAFRGVADLRLYTTPEAERAVDEVGSVQHAASGRMSLYLPDSHAAPVALTPVYGSYVTVSFAVPGLAPADLEQRLREILVRDFEIGSGQVPRVRTSAVEDRRVDVTDYEGRLVAVNVLSAEVPHLMERVEGTVVTRPSRGGGIVVGG